jgi:hypothetical protein
VLRSPGGERQVAGTGGQITSNFFVDDHFGAGTTAGAVGQRSAGTAGTTPVAARPADWPIQEGALTCSARIPVRTPR